MSAAGEEGAVLDVDLTVIGGGVAGLVTARTAARAGASVAVLEAAPDLGGLIGSHHLDDLTLDSGAESYATRGGAVADLVTELGLGADIVTPARVPARVHAGGRSRPMPRTGVLGIPTDFDAPGLSQVLGEDGLARARKDLELPAEVGATAGTLGALVQARMGQAVVENLLRPVVRGVHSVEPEELAASDLLPGIHDRLAEEGSLGGALRSHRAAAPAGSAVQGIRGGIHRLISALAADLDGAGAHLFPGAPCRALHLTADGWQVSTAQVVLHSRAVVLACPPHTWDFLSGGGRALHDLHQIASQWPSPTGVDLLTLILDTSDLPVHEPGGVLVADPGRGAKALTYASAKWDWLGDLAGAERAVLRLSYAAGIVPTGADQAGARIELAGADAGRLLGIEISPQAIRASAHHHLRLPHPVLGRGMKQRAEQVRTVCRSTPGLEVAGTWVAGTGLASVVPDSIRAAERLHSI